MTQSLPSGTVTLLFTDIEGSSALWDEHRGAMAHALSLHNELLTHCIASNEGIVVKDKGDGFFAVFATVTGAVGCALGAQRALASATWPDDVGPLKVRMAIHTGTIASDDGDYRGPVVNRVARLEGIAHGGQVLVSESAATLLHDSLPAGAGLADLGSHSLRGLGRPEQVYQLTAPDLPADFPPLRTDTSTGIPLPSYPTSFVGRGAEEEAIGEMLAANTRLVTLLGPGGIGKTRLAVETARRLGGQRDSAVYFADLARIDSADDVGLAIAGAVGAHTEGTASPVALAAGRISGPTILVLDNFEHVQAAATTVAELIDASDLVSLIATSRAPLHIRGEQIFHVEALDATSANGAVPPAIALFYERAAGHGVNLSAEGPDAAAVATIVKRLDGLPLAIELVAARTRLVGVTELATMLSGSLDALGSGAADLPERQRTIRATIEWSLQALTADQRDLFTRLAVFPAGATLAQLQAVASRGPELLDDLAALVDNSLVNVATGLPGGTRYRQLVLMREYGAELLRGADETETTMSRLVDHYRETAPEIGLRLQNSEAPHRDLRTDHANLLAAMMWSLDHDRIADMVDVISSVWIYWFNGDHAENGSAWVDRADALIDSPRLDFLVGLFALQAGAGDVAITRFTKASERFTASGDHEWAARSQVFLSFFVEDPIEGLAIAERTTAYFVEEKLGVDAFMARLMLSAFYLQSGEVARGIAMRRQVLVWAEAMDYTTMVAWAAWNLAIALLIGEEFDEAAAMNRRSLEMMIADGYREGTASAADLFAVIWIHRGDVARGLKTLGASNRVWDSLGAVRWPEAQYLVDAALANAMESQGAAEADRLLAEGATLSYGEMVALLTTD